MNYNWNWGVFWEASPEGTGNYLDMLLSGARWTIVTAVIAWIVALVFGSLVGVARTLPSRSANGFATTYVEFFRNIPILVQSKCICLRL
jgi:glutamate/aspartate transport system permease protein